MCADIAIHDKQDGNPHAHVMLTIRPIEQDGTWGAKQKKEYILDKDGNKIYDRKSVLTNANPFPPPTGTSRAKRRNGAAHGRKAAIGLWSSTDTQSA